MTYPHDQKAGDGRSTGARPRRLLERLHVGNGAFDIIGKRKRLYVAFGGLVLACLLMIVLRGFNFGIEFEGGTQLQMPAQGANGSISESDVRGAFLGAIGQGPESVQVVGSGGSASIQ
ncbi:MAG: protein translocase subunit SecF, partial [Sciscionella sp.]